MAAEQNGQGPEPIGEKIGETPHPVPRKLDLSNVTIRTRNMVDAEVVIRSNSYIAVTSVLGAKLIGDACRALGLGTVTPDLLAMSELEGNAEDLLAVPTTVKDASTVNVRWVKKTRAHIDLKSVLMLRRFPLPENARAHLPLSLENVPDVGPVIRFHFGKVRVEQIRANKKKAPAPRQESNLQQGAEPDKAAGI